jgi:phosphoribosylglycinamide formyltransferase-1
LIRKLAVAASGGGSNFRAILDAIKSGILKARVAGLIVTRREAGAAGIAREHDIPVHCLESGADETGKLTFELLSCIRDWDADLLILAGFLRKVPDPVTGVMNNRILNIHPSLLPKFGGKGFYGLRVHEAVILAGETHSGCTVHLVNEEYDAGRILEQSVVPVKPGDTPETLAFRVLQEEHKLYPAAIQNYLESLN